MPSTARAQGLPPIIRDTEIENALRDWSRDVAIAAELAPGSVNFILVQDSNINAFVAGGPNIFIYTGLIEKSSSPGEVLGVIAHEMGHIRGGHLIRAQSAMNNASYETMLGTLLGLGAALISGNGSAAMAGAAVGRASALNKYLSFSRMQESSADQAALSYLNRAKTNPSGLETFMEKLESEELLPASQQSEYVRTHPLTRTRLDTIGAAVERSAYKDTPLPAAWEEEHRRVVAKLIGFTSPDRVPWTYNPKDQSIAARYARAIASYRQAHMEQALTQMDALLKEEPDNAYFVELKAQMLSDFGRVSEALPLYRQAIGMLPKAPLIRIPYAQALIESAGQNNTAQLDEAIVQLNRALQDEPRSGRSYRLLATAYGRKNNEAMAKLYLAEEALLRNNKAYAAREAQAALQTLKPGTPARQRAQDILSLVEQSDKKE